jgi:ferredoxin
MSSASASAMLAAVAIVIHHASAYTIAPHRIGLNTPRSTGGLQRQLPLSSSSHRRPRPLFSEPVDDDINFDPNRWISSEVQSSLGDASWEQSLSRSDDDWSSFASSDDETKIAGEDYSTTDIDGGEDEWLDALASIAADEINFMSKEADRADKVRQMQEMGYSSESISSTLGVAIDDELETDESNEIFEAFKVETAKTGFGLMVDEDVDLELVESHTRVEWDEETDEPVRAQHVYVDEVTCIGCTNCAMIAQSTFYMNSEHGRARVFQQWGGELRVAKIGSTCC